MKFIMSVVTALASIAAAHAQVGFFGFSGTGVGSATLTDYNYITDEYSITSVENGTAQVSFGITFYGDIFGYGFPILEGGGGETITSEDGTALGNGADANTFSGYVNFSGSRRSGSGSITGFTPANDGIFTEYFSYDLQTNGLYSITGGGTGSFRIGYFGEGTYFGSWSLSNVTLNLDGAPVVPEPGTWGMMICGMAVAGSALRYRGERRRATA